MIKIPVFWSDYVEYLQREGRPEEEQIGQEMLTVMNVYQ